MFLMKLAICSIIILATLGVASIAIDADKWFDNKIGKRFHITYNVIMFVFTMIPFALLFVSVWFIE